MKVYTFEFSGEIEIEAEDEEEAWEKLCDKDFTDCDITLVDEREKE